MASHVPAMEEEHHDSHGHPTQKKYVEIAAILAVITAIEVFIYYLPFMHDHGLLVPALLILSLIKFFFVVGFFMHLKFDSKLLAATFGFALVISVIMFIALWVIMHYDAVDMSQVVQDMSL